MDESSDAVAAVHDGETKKEEAEKQAEKTPREASWTPSTTAGECEISYT